jgi:uncharacterized protein (TIGR03067 family)
MNAALSLALLALATAAPVPEKSDAKKIQGTWALNSKELDGKALETRPGERLVISADDMRSSDGKESFTYKLGSAGELRTIDISADRGPLKGKTLHGLYRLDGDNLTICTPSEPGGERPTEITSKGMQRIITLSREKK